VLRRTRTAILTALSLGVAAAAGTAAPAASASPAANSSAALATRAHFPAGAGKQLASELEQAWQITRGQGVTIALLSTAVDPVTGLAGKLIRGPNYAPLAGASAVEGTLLASLIAGSGPTGTDPFGAIGRAPGAKILTEQVADYGSHGDGKYLADGTWQNILARAIRYAADHGANVIVADSGGDADAPELDSAVQYAISKNVVVIGSATGSPGKTPTPLIYPDSLPGVINVTGVPLSGLPKPQGPNAEPANNSVLVAVPDNTLDATGPGDNPYSAWGYYSDLAWAAGTVALIKAVYPQITPAEVARALAESASYRPSGGYSISGGFGLINPIGALHDAAALLKLGTTAGSGSGTVSASSRFGTAQPAVIDAVQHAKAKLYGFGGAMVVGLVLLLLALILGLRRRRRRPVTVTAGGGPPPIALSATGFPPP
jgi:Subtilase family